MLTDAHIVHSRRYHHIPYAEHRGWIAHTHTGASIHTAHAKAGAKLF